MMGYFSNGSEGYDYGANFCDRCVHRPIESDEGDCPIQDLHSIWNYDQCAHQYPDKPEAERTASKAKEEALGTFIPRHGIYNLACRMFTPRDHDRWGDFAAWWDKHSKDGWKQYAQTRRVTKAIAESAKARAAHAEHP